MGFSREFQVAGGSFAPISGGRWQISKYILISGGRSVSISDLKWKAPRTHSNRKTPNGIS